MICWAYFFFQCCFLRQDLILQLRLALNFILPLLPECLLHRWEPPHPARTFLFYRVTSRSIHVVVYAQISFFKKKLNDGPLWAYLSVHWWTLRTFFVHTWKQVYPSQETVKNTDYAVIIISLSSLSLSLSFSLLIFLLSFSFLILLSIFFVLFFWNKVFEPSHYVVMTVLGLDMQTSLASNSQKATRHSTKYGINLVPPHPPWPVLTLIALFLFSTWSKKDSNQWLKAARHCCISVALS